MRVGLVGTGTGVGKTHVGCAVLVELRKLGRAPRGLKPVESGWVAGSGGSDGERLGAAAGHGVLGGPYRFGDAVSAHLAARRAGVQVEVEVVRGWVDSVGGAWTVVEGAGGLLSPLGVGVSNLELMRELAVDVLVVAALDRLGVLHELSAVAFVLAGCWSGRWLVALSTPDHADESTGTNATELSVLGLVPGEVIPFPRAALEDPATAEAAQRLLGALARADVSRQT